MSNKSDRAAADGAAAAIVHALERSGHWEAVAAEIPGRDLGMVRAAVGRNAARQLKGGGDMGAAGANGGNYGGGSNEG